MLPECKRAGGRGRPWARFAQFRPSTFERYQSIVVGPNDLDIGDARSFVEGQRGDGGTMCGHGGGCAPVV